VKAIILAAGVTECPILRERYGEIPKCLLEIETSTIIELQLNILHSCGIEDIVVIKGYKSDDINIPGLRYYENKDYQATGVLETLMCAEKELDDDCVILYSDILFEKSVLERILISKSDISLGVETNWEEAFKQRKSIKRSDFELVSFDSDGNISEIGKSTDDTSNKSKGIYNGILKLSKSGAIAFRRNYSRAKELQHFSLPKKVGTKTAWISDLLAEMVSLGVPIHCVINKTGWLEINTHEDYERALEDSQFLRKYVSITTDWETRSKVYNNLAWVNKNELLDTIVNEADLIEGQSVLDLGTGTGKILIALKERYPNVNYSGIDISSDMMSKIPPEHNFDLSVSTIENMEQFDDNQFDLIVARMVFHHSTDLEQAINEVYRILKKNGKFILCEGNPPNNKSYSFYKNMFFFKEDRHTLYENDLINLQVNGGFSNISTKTVIYPESSLNNWLSNSGLPFRNIDIITKMHYECDEFVKEAYNMKFVEDDILMDWKFSVVVGVK